MVSGIDTDLDPGVNNDMVTSSVYPSSGTIKPYLRGHSRVKASFFAHPVAHLRGLCSVCFPTGHRKGLWNTGDPVEHLRNLWSTGCLLSLSRELWSTGCLLSLPREHYISIMQVNFIINMVNDKGRLFHYW